MPGQRPEHRALFLFGLLCLLVVVGVAGYGLYSRREAFGPASIISSADSAAHIGHVRRRAHLLYRHTGLGPDYGRVAIVALDAPHGPRVLAPLSCDSLYATDGAGLCLQASRGVFTSYEAVSFDASFRQRHRFTLQGPPSRTRVSRNGRLAASTVFVSGDSYASGRFSTRTTIFDLERGRLVADLEQFAVRLHDAPFKRPDFNFWGVTFADDDRFFATLSTTGTLYLVEGRVSDRSMRVVRSGVECPSLSPNGRRLAFKSRMFVDGRMVWRLYVLELERMIEHPVSETRNVDDQAEWLDNAHLLYALPGDTAGSSNVWMANADGTGRPSLLLRDAYSPSVVRPDGY